MLNNKANYADVVPYVCDSFLQSNAINTDLVRPNKTGVTNVKVDYDLAVVGSCNISPGPLVVDGTSVVNELLPRAPVSNPTFTGIATCGQLNLSCTSSNLSPPPPTAKERLAKEPAKGLAKGQLNN